VNFLNVKINPHGNGTHTECVGHITSEPFTINQCLKEFIFIAELISIYPVRMENDDEVIMREQVEKSLGAQRPDALIIRTFPNDILKLKKNYSGKNPPFLHDSVAEFLVSIGVKHLLVDLPSVDREEDGGKLLFHKTFWQYPHAVRKDATITELIFVPGEVEDGKYLLNLQIASFELDASPSKPVLYQLTENL
jgi:arylformamidase